MSLKHFTLSLALAATLGCASTSDDSPKLAERHYTQAARSHEQSAKEWQESGIRTMAEHHQRKAAEAHHNERASSCDWFDWFLTAIILDSDACYHKTNFGNPTR